MVSTVVALDPPADFDAERVAIWKEVTGELALMKGLSPVDRKPLAMYVDVLYRLLKVGQQLNSFGSNTMSVKSKDGKTVIGAKTLPQFHQYMALTSQALRFAQNFGMTPSARARIVFFGAGAQDDPNPDPFA